jgi:cytochrome P450
VGASKRTAARRRVSPNDEKDRHAATDEGVYYDPYDFEIDSDPYPVWQRLRDEQPLYCNERCDFYALSRFADVERARPGTTRCRRARRPYAVGNPCPF